MVVITHRGRNVAGLTHSVVFGGGHRPDEEEEEEVIIGWQEKLFSQVSQHFLSSVYLHPPDSHSASDSYTVKLISRKGCGGLDFLQLCLCGYCNITAVMLSLAFWVRHSPSPGSVASLAMRLD